jgi:hypothetical protein
VLPSCAEDITRAYCICSRWVCLEGTTRGPRAQLFKRAYSTCIRFQQVCLEGTTLGPRALPFMRAYSTCTRFQGACLEGTALGPRILLYTRANCTSTLSGLPHSEHSFWSARPIVYARALYLLLPSVGCLVSTALGPRALLLTRVYFTCFCPQWAAWKAQLLVRAPCCSLARIVPASALSGLPGQQSSWSARPTVNARTLYLLWPSMGCLLVNTALGPRALLLTRAHCYLLLPSVGCLVSTALGPRALLLSHAHCTCFCPQWAAC